MHCERWLAAAALACGGWVCNSDGDAPCSDELTCSTPVAGDVCCPLGSPYWCDGTCSPTPTCSSPVTCVNGDGEFGACTEAAFMAQIDSATCSPGEHAGTLNVVATGQIVGCGSIAAQLGVDSGNITLSGGDCGGWILEAPNQHGLVCVPTSVTSPVETAWELEVTLGSPVSSTRVFVATPSGHEIASKSIACQ